MLEVSERERQMSVVTIVVHEICTISGLDQPFSSILMQDCAVEAGKQRRRFEPVIDSDLS